MCNVTAQNLYIDENRARAELDNLRDSGARGAMVAMAKKRYLAAKQRRRSYVTPALKEAA